MAFLNSAASYLRSFSFVNNVKKMRSSLIEFFKEEGITCEVKDGILMFEYKELWYGVNFIAGDDYAECGIVFSFEDELYEKLELADKTLMAAKVNNEVDNHATIYVYNDSFKIVSTFYFASKSMLMELFMKHFTEMRECINAALELLKESIVEEESTANEKPKQIGFCVQPEEANEN